MTVQPWYAESAQHNDVYHVRDDCPRYDLSVRLLDPDTTRRRLCYQCLLLLMKEVFGDGL